MKTYRHWDADYTPNDIGPPDKTSMETRSGEEVGKSELETIEEWARLKEEDIKNDL